ncbi:MAG: hypothetical protein J6S19_08120, partial [Lentisphaeria bacterium]|nr:hypothetical protein [Lentisphaeria bacterium]
YSYTMILDVDQLKPGITAKDFRAAVQAEGVCAHEMWGQVMYKQNLWTVAPDQFRIDSCEVAEKLVYDRLIHMDLRHLMLPENETALIADAFEKVMNAYHA